MNDAGRFVTLNSKRETPGARVVSAWRRELPAFASAVAAVTLGSVPVLVGAGSPPWRHPGLPLGVGIVLGALVWLLVGSGRRARRPLTPRWFPNTWRDAMCRVNGCLLALACGTGAAVAGLLSWHDHEAASAWRSLGAPLVLGATALAVMLAWWAAWMLPTWTARAVLRGWLPVRLRNEFLALGACGNPLLLLLVQLALEWAAVQAGWWTAAQMDPAARSVHWLGLSSAGFVLGWVAYGAVRMGLWLTLLRPRRADAAEPLLWIVVDSPEAASMRQRLLEPLLNRPGLPTAVLLAPADSGVGTVLGGEHLMLAQALGFVERLRPALAVQLQDWLRTLPPRGRGDVLPVRELYPAPALMVQALRTLVGPHDRVLLVFGLEHGNETRWGDQLAAGYTRVVRLKPGDESAGADGLPAIDGGLHGRKDVGHVALLDWSELDGDWSVEATSRAESVAASLAADGSRGTASGAAGPPPESSNPAAAGPSPADSADASAPAPVSAHAAAAEKAPARLQIQISAVSGDEWLRYTLSTSRARYEASQQVNAALLNPLLNQLAELDRKPEQALLRTLATLLIPREVFENIVTAVDGARPAFDLLLDDSTDRLPWELLLAFVCHGGSSEAPAPVRVVRSLRDPFTAPPSMRSRVADRDTALLIADPASDRALGLHPLPGARREAGRQAAALRAAGFDVQVREGASAGEVIKSLLGHDWRVLLLTGHGLAAESEGSAAGMPLTDQVRLTVRELRQMQRVPELVFANVQMLGSTLSTQPPADAAKGMDPPPREPTWARGLTEMEVTVFVLAAGALSDDAAADFGAAVFERACLNGGTTIGEAMFAACQSLHRAGLPPQQWAAYRLYGDANHRLYRGSGNQPAAAPGSAARA